MPPDPSGRASALRLAIAPDAALVVAGLQDVLARTAPDIEVIVLGELADDVLRADLLVYDPQKHEPESVLELRERAPLARLVAYCWSIRPDLVDEARRLDAAAFLSKELAEDELVAAIRAVRAGHHGRFLFKPYLPVVESSSRPHGLTQRELEVLELITQGHSNGEIAERLYLSINSVKSYIRTGYRKIGATRRAQALLWGVENGLGAAPARSD